jgi:CRP-like cAMP-binding protein
MSRAEALTRLQATPRLAINLAVLLAKAERAASFRVEIVTAQSLRRRVARQLLDLVCSDSTAVAEGCANVHTRITQSDLAEMVAASREPVNKILVALKQDGCVTTNADRCFVIRDIDALREIAEQCPRKGHCSNVTAKNG